MLTTLFDAIIDVVTSPCHYDHVSLMCLMGLMYRKAIQGEIKISTESGETRTLRSAPDWGVSN